LLAILLEHFPLYFLRIGICSPIFFLLFYVNRMYFKLYCSFFFPYWKDIIILFPVNISFIYCTKKNISFICYAYIISKKKYISKICMCTLCFPVTPSEPDPLNPFLSQSLSTLNLNCQIYLTKEASKYIFINKNTL
jgi:hypothetical protein